MIEADMESNGTMIPCPGGVIERGLRDYHGEGIGSGEVVVIETMSQLGDQHDDALQGNHESHVVENESSDLKVFASRDDSWSVDVGMDDLDERIRVDMRRGSLVSEISTAADDWNDCSLPRRGLDHCTTAPVGTLGGCNSSVIGSHEITLARCKTQKENIRIDLKLDRLSDCEKKKIIGNLVKIQKDGTVQVDLTRNTSVASELLELQKVEESSLDVENSIAEMGKSIPRLKIAMLVVGTRGDVQPFLAIAKRLKESQV